MVSVMAGVTRAHAAWFRLNTAGYAVLYPIEKNPFEKLLHGRISFFDKIFEGERFLAGWASHEYLVAGSCYMQRCCALWTGEGCLCITR